MSVSEWRRHKAMQASSLSRNIRLYVICQQLKLFFVQQRLCKPGGRNSMLIFDEAEDPAAIDGKV